MEESKLRTHSKPPLGSGRPGSSGASKSSHVIDLRAVNSTPKPPSAAVPSVKKPRRTPAAKPAPTRRPLAAPNQSAIAVTPAARSASAPAPAAAPVQAIAPSAQPVVPSRRFWPAFWRFLLLLVILALLVVGGVYLYINYYRT